MRTGWTWTDPDEQSRPAPGFLQESHHVLDRDVRLKRAARLEDASAAYAEGLLQASNLAADPPRRSAGKQFLRADDAHRMSWVLFTHISILHVVPTRGKWIPGPTQNSVLSASKGLTIPARNGIQKQKAVPK